MSKKGPGPTHCSQKRSVGVKKKGLILSSNYLDQRRINFIWFCFIQGKNGSFPNCLLQLTFSRTNQASSSSVPIVDYSNFPHTHLTSNQYTRLSDTQFEFQTQGNAMVYLYVMLRATHLSVTMPCRASFSSLSRYYFSHHAQELNYVQKI